MTSNEVEAEIIALIDKFAKTLNDGDFLDALETMADCAGNAIEARKEELGENVD